MGSGPLFVVALLGLLVFAVASRWRRAFGILGVCSVLTGMFYGCVWLLEREAAQEYQRRFGDLDLTNPGYTPRGVHTIIMDFEPQVMVLLWGVGLLLFSARLISDLDTD